MAIVRINFNTFEDGEEYKFRLADEANRNLKVFFTMLSSYWQSTIDGPNYARELKAMSIELARLRMALEEIRTDTFYASTRSEFLFQVLTQALFPKKAPNPEFSDLDFRAFLRNVLEIYFKGSIPDSIKKAVQLLVGDNGVVITEYFKEARKPGSGFDISDQFGFGVDVIMDSPGDIDVFLAEKNIRVLLNIIRPAHTLYRLRFILSDEYFGNQDPDQPPDAIGINAKIVDSFDFVLSCYDYEDFRKFISGVEGVDTFGSKKPVSVIAEDHSSDF